MSICPQRSATAVHSRTFCTQRALRPICTPRGPSRGHRRSRRGSLVPQATASAQPVGGSYQTPGTLPEQGSAALNAMVAEAEHKQPSVLGEKAEYVIDASGQKGEIIYVNDDFNVEDAEGAHLTEDLVVGKQIAGGAQGAIYELSSPDGSECGKLLKTLKFKAALPITGNDIGLKREWMIGQHLNRLRGPNGELSGFMGTGAAVIRKSDDGLEGLILEKVNGMPLEKRLLKDETFADAKYIMELLRQTFAALDRANRELGYVHRDMRVGNIMEHRPEGGLVLPKGFSAGKSRSTFKLPGDKRPAALKFAIIDNGHARLLGSKVPSKLPKVPMLEKMYRKWFSGKSDVWRLCQDLAECMDGRVWPDQDKEQVKTILALIKEVTGACMYAFYKGPEQGARKRKGFFARIKGFFTMWQYSGKPGHIFRRLYIRFRVWFFPRKTRYTAAEALDFLRARKVLSDDPEPELAAGISSRD